jgi:hypothetical protein
MSEALARRLAALAGLALATAVGLWWLGSTRLALDDGSDSSRNAVSALHAVWLLRAIVLAMLCMRVGALRGWRAGAQEALVLIAPAWPVVVLAWAASAAPWTQVALAECLLLTSALALPLIGQGLRRALPRADVAEMAGTLVGTALAASVWLTRGLWALPVS